MEIICIAWQKLWTCSMTRSRKQQYSFINEMTAIALREKISKQNPLQSWATVIVATGDSSANNYCWAPLIARSSNIAEQNASMRTGLDTKIGVIRIVLHDHSS